MSRLGPMCWWERCRCCRSRCAAGGIFFNDVGPLGMWGYGTMAQIDPGIYNSETPLIC
jgi:hypothetical protein